MAFLARLARAPSLKTLIRAPHTRALGSGFQTSPDDFTQPVDAFVTEALTSHGIEATKDLSALHNEQVTNMGLLKSVDLNDVGLTVGGKTAIVRALTRDKAATMRKVISMEREASRTACTKKRAI